MVTRVDPPYLKDFDSVPTNENVGKVFITTLKKPLPTSSNPDTSTPYVVPNYLIKLKSVATNDKVGQSFVISTKKGLPKKKAIDLTKISLPLSQTDFEKLQILESTEAIEQKDFPKELWEAYDKKAGEIAQARLQKMIDSGEIWRTD